MASIFDLSCRNVSGQGGWDLIFFDRKCCNVISISSSSLVSTNLIRRFIPEVDGFGDFWGDEVFMTGLMVGSGGNEEAVDFIGVELVPGREVLVLLL